MSSAATAQTAQQTLQTVLGASGLEPPTYDTGPVVSGASSGRVQVNVSPINLGQQKLGGALFAPEEHGGSANGLGYPGPLDTGVDSLDPFFRTLELDPGFGGAFTTGASFTPETGSREPQIIPPVILIGGIALVGFAVWSVL